MPAQSGTTASSEYVLGWAQGVTIVNATAEQFLIHAPLTGKAHRYKNLSDGLFHALQRLTACGATEPELADCVAAKDGPAMLARLYYYLLLFAQQKLLSYAVVSDGQRLATLNPTAADFHFSPAPINHQAQYRLSRFAYLHQHDDAFVLESPLAHGQITLSSPEVAAMIAVLAQPQTLTQLAQRLPGLAASALALLLEMLVNAGFVSELDAEGRDAGASEALDQWEFHDLLFHARTRLGRHTTPYGGTYRFRETIKPLPAIKPSQGKLSIALHKPDIDSLTANDLPFTQVLERRRSIREYGAQPLDQRQLGEFLYRSARIKQLSQRGDQELSQRVYPSGGGIYELEIYLTIRTCDGLPAGLYHYCPHSHQLNQLSGPTPATEALLEDGRRSAGLDDLPQILITFTARFPRLSWKYERIAYRLVLKHVGALYQTLYLVATAMDLAPCALGSGNTELFTRAAELDPYSETSVGEFLLGSKTPN